MSPILYFDSPAGVTTDPDGPSRLMSCKGTALAAEAKTAAVMARGAKRILLDVRDLGRRGLGKEMRMEGRPFVEADSDQKDHAKMHRLGVFTVTRAASNSVRGSIGRLHHFLTIRHFEDHVCYAGSLGDMTQKSCTASNGSDRATGSERKGVCQV